MDARTMTAIGKMIPPAAAHFLSNILVHPCSSGLECHRTWPIFPPTPPMLSAIPYLLAGFRQKMTAHRLKIV